MREDEEEARRCWQAPPLDRDDLRRAAGALAEAYPIIDAVYLFGSQARGCPRPTSDVDIAVLLYPGDADQDFISEQAEMARFVEELLEAPVDVVVVHRNLPPGLLFEMFAHETILYSHDYERAHEAACRARAAAREELPRLERVYDRVRQRLQERVNALNDA